MWKSTKSRISKGQISFDGGVNRGNPPIKVGDNQSIDEYGWDTDSQPALHTRKSNVAYGTSGVLQTNLLANFNNVHLVRAVGGTLQYWNGTAWTNITGTFTDTDWDATNFEVAAAGALILTNGTDNVKYWNGSALADLNAVSAPKGKYICNDTVRVWIALNDIVYYSAFLNATDWTTAQNSGSVEFYTRTGGNITGIKSFADNNKYVWKQNAFAVIFGTDYFNYSLRVITTEIGCVSFKTIQEVSTPQGAFLFWLGMNDVYLFNGGYPLPIGQPIRYILDSINATYWSKCMSGTDGIRYFLGLVTGANTEVDTWVMYDPRYAKWRIVSTGDHFRYSAVLNENWYVGDASGNTYTMQTGAYTGVTWSVTTKDFDEGIPEAEKEYFELYIQMTTPTGTTFTLEVSTDQGTTWLQIGDPITVQAIAQNIPTIIPLDTVALTPWIRFRLSGTGEITIYQLERYFRVQPLQI